VRALAMKLFAAGRVFGPYLAIELVLPGGSMLALLLWLYRASHHGAVTARNRWFRPSRLEHLLRPNVVSMARAGGCSVRAGGCSVRNG
jgi:hypothetical protein